MSSQKRPRPIDDLLRHALWEAHGHKCAYDPTGAKIERLGDMEVDHVLPESLWRNDPRLPGILKTLDLPPDYHRDSLDNLLPVRKGSNRQKGDWVFSESSSRFYREIAAKMQDAVERLCLKLEDSRKQERIRSEIQAACAANPDMRSRYLAVLADTPPFPNEEVIAVDSLRFSRSRVRLHCHLPMDSRDGSLLIQFNSLYLHAVSFTFEAQEILSRLLRGWSIDPVLGQRGFMLGRAEDRNDEWIVTLGGATIFLTNDELTQLGAGLDFLAPRYLGALRHREIHDGTFAFEPEGSRNVRLLTIKRVLWREIQRFADEHDYDKGSSPWHVFDAGGFGHIKIIRRTPSGEVIPFEAYVYTISPEKETHGAMIEPEDDVCLCWDANLSCLNRRAGDDTKTAGWSAAQTAEWLKTKLFPEIVRRTDKPSLLDRFRQYTGLKEPPVYFSESYGVPASLLNLPASWSEIVKFTRAVQVLYIEHSHEPVARAVVESALAGLIVLADALPVPGDKLGYIAGKLGVPCEGDLSQIVAAGRTQLLGQDSFTSSDLEHVLRCGIAVFNSSTPSDRSHPDLLNAVTSAWQSLAAAAQHEAIRHRMLDRLQHPSSR